MAKAGTRTLASRIRSRLKKEVLRRPGTFSRFIQFPLRSAAPYRARTLDVCRSAGLGDVLMCTPALRQLKHTNPGCYVRFYTDYVSLVKGLPYIDEVHPTGMAPAGVRYLGYEGGTPPKGNLARIIGDRLGIDVRNTKPDCVVDPALVEEYRRLLAHHPKPHMVVLRRASRWTPNKDWPEVYWEQLVESAQRIGTVIEIGIAEPGAVRSVSHSYIDWRGQTSIEQMVAIIAVCDLHVGPVSGPMHIAAAVGTPAVVIYGGYEHPIGHEGYVSLFSDKPRPQINLYSPVSCAPCWKIDACPYNLKCLAIIEPPHVLAAIQKIVGTRTVSA